MPKIRILDLGERLSRRREVTDQGCWLWTGTTNNEGYGTTGVGGKMALVHRVSFELANGPIPAGAVLDHLCRSRRCFNPDHLEAVTQRENTLRSPITLGSINAAKTHCPQGHEYTPENTYIVRRPSPNKSTNRRCKTCAREQYQRRAAARAERGVGMTAESWVQDRADEVGRRHKARQAQALMPVVAEPPCLVEFINADRTRLVEVWPDAVILRERADASETWGAGVEMRVEPVAVGA